MKKKILLFLAACLLYCLFASQTVMAADSRVQAAVNNSIQMLNGNLHPEYSRVSYAYPERQSYRRLNAEQKALYRELYEKVSTFQEFTYTVEEYSHAYMDMILQVWLSLKTDHPELDNYFTFQEINNEDGILLALESKYYASWDMDREVSLSTLKESQKRFEETADYIVRNMPANLSTYDKYRYLAYVISLLTEYNYGESTASDAAPYGALMSGKSICQGYATAMCYLCRKADLYCVMASGSSRGEGHAWNLVKLSTGTYHIDITWSDERGYIGSPPWMSLFMVTQSTIEADDHVVDSEFHSSGKLNYNSTVNGDIPEKGAWYRDSSSGAAYRVVNNNVENLQVAYYRPLSRTQTKLVVPGKIQINGNTFKVTRIASKAFLNNRNLKNLVIRTPYLKYVGAQALKGIHKNARIYVPRQKLADYRSLLKNKGQQNTVKIVNI